MSEALPKTLLRKIVIVSLKECQRVFICLYISVLVCGCVTFQF